MISEALKNTIYKKSQVLIAAYDAGGAQILSAWVKKNPVFNYLFFLDGPALEIFSKKIPSSNIPYQQTNNLVDIQGCDIVLTATGLATEFERRVMLAANKHNKYLIAYLDHWVNYEARFLYLGHKIVADEIWVGDKAAYKLAKEIFRTSFVMLQPNVYFEEILQEMKQYHSIEDKQKRILFIGQPLLNYPSEQKGELLEITLLKRYIDRLLALGINLIHLKIRPHPRESANKYETLLRCYESQLKIEISGEEPLAKDCVWAKTVVGFDSMGLVVAKLAKKEVYSLLPMHISSTLPLKSIKKISV